MDEHHSVSQLLQDELEDYGLEFTGAQRKAVSEIVARAAEWERTSNPFFIERAFEHAVHAALPITATLSVEMVEAIKLRREGSKGSWGQVVRWEWKPRAYLVMCNLIFHGSTLEDASAIASPWLERRSKTRLFLKASTLQKDYADDWRKTGIEADLHELWSAKNSQKERSDWVDFAKKAERATRQMIGTRR